MVQDDIVGHVETLPDAQVVKQRWLPEHVTHIHHGNVWKEEDNNNNNNVSVRSRFDLHTIQLNKRRGFLKLEIHWGP